MNKTTEKTYTLVFVGTFTFGRMNFKFVHGVMKDKTFSGELNLCKHMKV